MGVFRRHGMMALAGAALLAGTGGAAWHFREPSVAQATALTAAALPAIEAAAVTELPLAEQRAFSGRIEAVEQVEVRPLVSGTITAVHFRDGDLVARGERLFTIDRRPFQAALDRAQGELEAAKSAAQLARSDLERAKPLVGKGTITQRDFDTREHAARDTEARLVIAQAAVTTARIDLDHTEIAAPIAGRISRAEFTLGNVVTAGGSGAPLSRIVSVSPVYAAFDADEQSYLAFIGRARDAGRALPVELGLAGELGFSRRGSLASVDNRLDTASGTIRIRAVFDNAGGTLIPGLYARVRVSAEHTRPALLVDPRAVNVDQDKKFVLVVGDDSRVSYREVRLGEERDGRRQVLDGLVASERVVIAGAQALKPGDQVRTISKEASVP